MRCRSYRLLYPRTQSSSHPSSHAPTSQLRAAWIYDRDPFQPMRWQDDLEKFKARLQRGEDVFGECHLQCTPCT